VRAPVLQLRMHTRGTPGTAAALAQDRATPAVERANSMDTPTSHTGLHLQRIYIIQQRRVENLVEKRL